MFNNFNDWGSLLNGPFGVYGVVVLVLAFVWLTCAFSAVFLLPFVMIRFHRALGNFNRAYESGALPNAATQRVEPQVPLAQTNR